jgi:hypothetical protein
VFLSIAKGGVGGVGAGGGGRSASTEKNGGKLPEVAADKPLMDDTEVGLCTLNQVDP